jgi:hypothetical protein
MAYYKSFVAISTRNLGAAAQVIPQYNDEAELLSLEARQRTEIMQESDASTEKALKIAEVGARQAIAIAMIAVIIAGLSPFVSASLADKNNATLQRLSALIISNLVEIAYWSMVGIVAFYVAPRMSRFMLAKSSSLGRSILELTNVRRVGFMWGSAIGTLFLIILTTITSWPALVAARAFAKAIAAAFK